MLKCKVPEYLLCIIKSFLTNRSFAIRINSTLSVNKTATAGVPQGSILGPTLFNIFVHDLSDPPNATVTMYADDTALLSQHTDILQATQQLQDSVNVITEWFNKWCIKLNVTKTEAKIFTLRRPNTPPNILLENQMIEWNPADSAIKYLGVYLDKKLSWAIHIN